MNGTGADNSGGVLFTDLNRFPSQRTFVDTAYDLKLEYPVGFFIDDHESDFIHMRGDHYPQCVIVFCMFDGNQITDRIRRQIVCNGAYFPTDNRANFILVSGNSYRVTQFFKELYAAFRQNREGIDC